MYTRQFIHTFREAVRDADIPPAYKLLLFTMSTYADSEGGNVFPSQAALATAVSGGERTVRRHLQHLQSANWLELVKRGSSGGVGRASRSANVYKLTVGCRFTAGPRGTIITQDDTNVVQLMPKVEPKVTSKPKPKVDPTPELKVTPKVELPVEPGPETVVDDDGWSAPYS